MQPGALLSSHFVMPSVPKVVALLLSELARPVADLRRIDQLVCTDPALTMAVLQAANASAFNLSGQLHSASEALAVLHLSQLKTMVSQAASGTSFRSAPGLSMQQFWAYSLDCARVARSLASLLRLNQQAAFSCGLIHAVGELAMRNTLSKAVSLDAQIGPFELKRARMERQVLGFCFTQITAALASQWHFPQSMVDALEYQHAPFENDVYEPLAGVLHLAVWRARTRQVGLTGNALTVTFPLLVAEVLGLDIDMVLRQDPIDWSAQVPGRTMSEPKN